MAYSATFVSTFHSMTLAFLSDHKRMLFDDPPFHSVSLSQSFIATSFIHSGRRLN